MAAYDVLQDILVKEITAYRNRDFATSLMVDVAIQADKEAATITFGHSRRIGCTRYRITAFAGTAMQLSIKCSKSRKPEINDKTRAKLHACLDLFERKTNPLDEYDVPEDIRRVRALSAQREWWQGNGKTFPLFSLPAELRDSIYSNILSPIVRPYPYHGCRRLTRRCAGELVQSPSLFTLSRQVRTEALDYYFRHTTFRIEHMPIWHKLVSNDYFVKNVKRVHIDLSLVDFMFFFNGVELQRPCPDTRRCLSRRALRKMSLTSAAIQLPHPRQLMQLAKRTICQTELITMCLVAVWPHVQGQLGTEILGIAAGDQGLAFKQACHKARAAYDFWKTNATTLGHAELTLEDYDRWVQFFAEDEDGGALVSGDHREAMNGWDKRCVGDVRCICASPCEASDNA